MTKNIMKEAHKMTKEMKAQYPEINYSFQLGLNIQYLLEGDKEMTITTNYGANEQKVREAIKTADARTIGFALKAFEEALESEKVAAIIADVKARCEREGSFENLNSYAAHMLVADLNSYVTVRTGNKDLDSKMMVVLRKVLQSDLKVTVK